MSRFGLKLIEQAYLNRNIPNTSFWASNMYVNHTRILQKASQVHTRTYWIESLKPFVRFIQKWKNFKLFKEPDTATLQAMYSAPAHAVWVFTA